MARPVSRFPTELELQILKILWQQAPRPARAIQAALAADGRSLARTSVITTLGTMVAKGYLSRRKQANTFLFQPAVSEADISGGMLDDVVDRVFDGSPSAALLTLFDVRDLQESELRELRRIIDRRLRES